MVERQDRMEIIMCKVSAIILSAGKGRRMNTSISKQYIEVYGKPIIYYTLMAFENSKVDEIIVVTSQEDIDYVRRNIVEKYGITKVKQIVAGGKERYDSVINGLEGIECDGKVLIHDGARPLIKVKHINHIIDSVMKCDACIAAMPVKDTIKIAGADGYVNSTPDRKYVWQIQTPQAFAVSLIKEAYEKMRIAGDDSITDDAMAVEKYTDSRIKLIETDYENIKITTSEDLIFLKEALTR